MEKKVNKKRMRLILVTLVTMGIIGYLIYTGVSDTMVYYLKVSELLEQTVEASEEGVRVGGKVLEGSVSWEPKDLKLNFTIEDEKATLPVVYHGQVPDSFQQGKDVIIEGTFADGLFVASQIMPTCPSKYE
jgi:cytochrome c-type biogenesis protein CcmE